MKPRRNAIGQFTSRKRKNPERSAPMGLSAAEIRRHVAGEAKTARGHHSLALSHYRESEHANLMRDYALADYHGRMAHEHELRAKALGKGKRRNPDPRQDTPESYGRDATDAVIRRRVIEEASTARGHQGLALAHRATARTFVSRGWYGWADYHARMADAHESMSHALAGVASTRRR